MSLSNEIQISFVTVVYSGELPLLELQARSIERFMPSNIIAEIIILVNDVDELNVIESLKSEYIQYYGSLKAKVRVVSSDEVFNRPKPGLINAFLNYWAKNPDYRFRKKKGGWFANNGWSMQQAFKLCSAKIATASHIVMLDTKNVFIQPVGLDDFVDSNGKARTRFVPAGKLHKRWLPPSCKALRVKYSDDFLVETTQYTTPFVIERQVLNSFLQTFEQYHDSVHGVFARRFIKPTEFMLINVFCKQTFGELSNVFSDGLIQANSFYTSFSAEHVDSVLAAAECGNVSILGLHVTVMGRLTTLQLERLSNLLIECKVVDASFDLGATRDLLVLKNAPRILKSQKKINKSNKT